MKVKKILAVAGVCGALIGAMFLGGCAPTLTYGGQQMETQEQLNAALQEKFNQGIDSVDVTFDNADAIAKAVAEIDITSDNADAIAKATAENAAEIERMKLVIEDMKKAADEVAQEDINMAVEDDLEYGTPFSFTFDDSDVDKLIDSEIRFNSHDYDVEETVKVDGAILTSGTGGELEFASQPYMVVDEGGIVYKYSFPQGIDLTGLSANKPLSVSLLGKEFEITSWTPSEMTVRYGQEYFMEKGDKVTAEGKEVELVMVGDGYVYVKVGEQGQKIDEGDTEEIDGVEVYCKEALNDDDGTDFATLRIGEDITEDISSGDEVEQFGVEYKNIDAPFVWDLNILSTEPYISIVLNVDHNSIDEDEDYPAIPLEGGIALPNNYLTLNFKEIVKTDNMDFKFYFDDNMLKIKGTVESVIVDGADAENGVAWFDGSLVYYKLNGNEKNTTLNNLKLVNDDTQLDFSYNGTILSLNYANIDLDLDFANSKFTDVLYNTNSIKDNDDDLLLGYGAVIKSPESNFDNEEFKIVLPDQQVTATITLG